MTSLLTFDWPAFVAALVLLCFPPSLWIKESVKRELAHQRTAGDFNLLRGLLAWQNWFDLARAYGGCFLLYEYAITPLEGGEWKLLGWRIGILLFALLLQTVRRHRGRTYFLAPVFFVWGLTFFLSDPLLAVYGIAAGTLVGVITNVEWKLPAMAVVVGLVGYLLGGIKIPLLVNVVVIVFPVIITFCGRGHMVFLTKQRA